MNYTLLDASRKALCLLFFSSLSACVSCQTPEQQRAAILGSTIGQHIGEHVIDTYGNDQYEHLGAAVGALGGALLGCAASQPVPVRPVVYYVPPWVQSRAYFDYAPICRRFEVQEYVNRWSVTSYETWCYHSDGSWVLHERSR